MVGWRIIYCPIDIVLYNFVLPLAMKKSVEDWISYAKHRKRYFFFYEEKVLDLTDFVYEHPGGKKALANYYYKDITDILFSVFPHKPDKTLPVLEQYVIGTLPPHQAGRHSRTDRHSSPAKEKKHVCFKKKDPFDPSNPFKEPEPRPTERNESNLKRPPINSPQRSLVTSAPNKQNKSKSKRFDVSIKTIDDHCDEPSLPKKCEKTEGNIPSGIWSGELDEQKPTFHVPVLQIRRMNEH